MNEIDQRLLEILRANIDKFSSALFLGMALFMALLSICASMKPTSTWAPFVFALFAALFVAAGIMAFPK